jgi:hypothetical protein
MLAIVVLLISLMSYGGLCGGMAGAVDTALLGGGAGIVVDGNHCTLTTIGHDGAGDLVGFTAAHCGPSGSEVSAVGTGGALGTVIAADAGLDYAVIKFDAARVIPTANFGGFPINGVGPDPAPNQPACKLGGATGTDCRFIRYFLVSNPDRPGARMQATWQPGDDGGPVTTDELLVGMIRTGSLDVSIDTISQPQIKMTFFSAILADTNARGGPGAGFTPVPA